MNSLPPISIIILNWNSYKDTKELLTSIKKSSYPKGKIETIIVDNASTDGSAKKIEKEFANIQLIALPKNLGTPARNAGIRKAKGEIIFSIDGDVSLAKNSLTTAVLKIQSDPSIGILGPRVLTKKGHLFQPSYMYFNLSTGTLRPAKKTDKNNSLFLAGTFHAFPKSIIRKVGLYEKKFFFYGDDLDFCLRVKKAGFKVLYYPNCVVFHGKDKSSPNITATTMYFYYYRSLFFNVFRHGNLISKITITIFQLLLMPFYKFIVKRENTFIPRLWGYWWNIKNFSIEAKILFFAVLIGAILRLFALGKRDFWFDEAFTYHLAKLPIKELFLAVTTDNNPPIYYLIIHFVLKLGQSEILLRLPSLVFSMLSIWAIYVFLQKIVNRKVAFTTASLYAVSPLTIYLSTEARLHSLATFILILTTALFFEILKKPSRRKISAFVLLAVLGLYTQYYLALLFLPFTVIVYMQKSRLSLGTWFKTLLLIFALLLPWLVLSATTIHNGCSCPSTLLSLPSSLVSPAIAGIGEVTLRSFPKLPVPIFAFFSVASITSLIFFLKGLFKNYLVSLLYILPLGFLSILGTFLPVFSPKAFAIFSPLFYTTMSVGVMSTQKKSAFSVLFITAFASISLTQVSLEFFQGSKIKPIHSIANTNSNLPILHTSTYTYYSTQYFAKDRQRNLLITKNPLSAETVKYIGGQKSEIANFNEFWFVDTKKWVEQEEYRNTTSQIFSEYKAINNYTFGDISVSQLKKI